MATKRCPYCVEEIQEEAIKCKHCGTWLASPPPEAYAAGWMANFAGPPGGAGKFASRRLLRSTGDAMWAGVCGGVARWVGIDPTIVRIAVALVSFFTAVVPGLIIYWILSMIIPPDNPALD
jgi:phage shock protein PspC (stress-responsive transcriptional regulator)